MSKAKPIYHEKFLFPEGSIVEMTLWQLPERTAERPHGLKYSLYYGSPDGTCIVRYDNEAGKGDHRHIGTKEEKYRFTNIGNLMADFKAEVIVTRGGQQ